jgi:hypothetical protein
MNRLLKEIRHNPLLWLLAFVPVVFGLDNTVISVQIGSA